MTREEAIKVLRYRSGWNLSIRDANALNMAIKALEQEPCEDAISREEAIGAVANLFEMSEYPHPYPQGKPIRLKDIKEKLKQLPPVQPKKIECVNAISRENALDALHMCLSTNSYDDDVTGDSYICYEEAEYEIEKLPSIQPKTGHWIPSHIPESILDECSECGFQCGAFTFNYCPMCGARMVKSNMLEIPTGSESEE